MERSNQQPERTLTDLASLIKSSLGVNDDDGSVSAYVRGIYDSLNTSTDLKGEFKKVMLENGGSEFPPGFIDSCFAILNVKSETTSSLLPSDPDLSKYTGLCMADRNVEPSKYIEIPSRPKKQETVPNEETIPLKVGEIYRGTVTNLTTYGAFVRLTNAYPPSIGLCHISRISVDGERIGLPSDVLKINSPVYIKVDDISEDEDRTRSVRASKRKISLSMRGIDQNTGKELEGIRRSDVSGERAGRDIARDQAKAGSKRRLTSPERWEINRLIASGAVSAEDFPEISSAQEDPNSAFYPGDTPTEETTEVEIELNRAEPQFLKGQTRNTIEFEPIQVFKNPEGSLSRTAMNGSKLASEFREEKFKEKKSLEKSIKAQSHKDVDDPLLSLDSRKHGINENNASFASKWKQLQGKSEAIPHGKRVSLSIKEQRETLPVFGMRLQIIEAVKDNQFLVIVGETGSGKTTQIAQYLMEEGFNLGENGEHKVIRCTQPRRVAASSVAKRVAEEVGCTLGREVGYSIRFEDKTSSLTKIKYMTDGMLQKEILTDPLMSQYSVIMLDEAHERTIATDVLFALLKVAVKKNPLLKVITTSATLDAGKFSGYFNACPVMTIPGRTFPVEILYTHKPEMDYLAASLDSVIQIHMAEPAGDILVFLTGQDEIDTSCEILSERMKILGDTVSELIVLPIYSALPSEMQSRIFEPTPPGSRKVILATNIAETSITIDGIYYVVDPGFVKINAYDSRLGMDTLMVLPISQAQANQRAGRAGRTGPGKCYRLYTESAYKNEMTPNTVPEIQRQNLSHTILMLKAMGINNMLKFDFMDQPLPSTMLKALHDLYTLSALDDEGLMTVLGGQMAHLPMEPALAKTLLISVEFGCLDEVLSIVAMLSVQTVFYRPKDKQNDADMRKRRLTHPHGDHLTLLNVYRTWQQNNYSPQWCQNNYIQERSMRRAQEVRRQLVMIMQRSRNRIESCGANLDLVRKAFTAGYFKNLAKRDPSEKGEYRTVNDDTPVFLHPSSSLVGKSPEYLLYHTLLLTTKEYMHCATVIEPQWLAELAPSYFKVADSLTISETKRGKKIVPLFDKFAKNKDEWRLSSQQDAKRRALGNT